MQISVTGKLKLFSWNSRDQGGKHFQPELWSNLGSKVKRISFLMEQRSEKKRPQVFFREGEPAGSETEKPWGKKA